MPVAGLLPTTPASDDLAVTRQRAKKLFDELLKTEDRGGAAAADAAARPAFGGSEPLAVGIERRPGTAREKPVTEVRPSATHSASQHPTTPQVIPQDLVSMVIASIRA